jgi:hypothetical protein
MDFLPGNCVDVGGLYVEINVFGTPTGRRARIGRGQEFPPLPLGFCWRLTEAEADREAAASQGSAPLNDDPVRSPDDYSGD